jgi:hypothetical protein
LEQVRGRGELASHGLVSTRPLQDTALLHRAWLLPAARRYQPLLSQSVLSICGPTSVANVLRSIGVDRGRNPFKRFGLRAMSLDQVTEESTAILPAGWRAETVRVGDVQALRVELLASNQPTHRYIANFSRRTLFGHGGGHHSPIGGYLEDEDLALVLDVNPSYGPWLISAERLLEALNTTDRGDGRSRGLVRFAQGTSSSGGRGSTERPFHDSR